MADRSVDRPQAGQKTALVTGAGIGGIGGSLSVELHKAGYFVFCAVRRPSTISEHLKPGMIAIELDVTSTDSITAAVKEISSITDDRLDILINNAGCGTHRPALDLDVNGAVVSMFDVNVFGVMRMVQACSNLLINTKGCIVNIGSIAPIVPVAYSSAYNASKAALHAYGDSLHMELKPLGVDVVTIITGGVKSNMVRENNPSLPENSRYIHVEKFWLQRVNLSQNGAMERDKYARKVVNMIHKKKKPIWLWSGGSASLAWFLYYFVPRS
ncbi:short chain dehydrogenase, partial [Penicillium daleae]